MRYNLLSSSFTLNMLKLGHMRVKSFLPLTEMNLMVEQLVESKINECWFEQRMRMEMDDVF